ncbi:hypothetical protein DICPUDRAFT_99444 [Dictyostelium purpureum]|uniref:Uncharacterized protein n=1 Tax=Dictyostelium purpureum TaxID=5786 RepID=F0ZZ86_DICPU|nr:uncharacterized protein DICPUDRAFT_99444 [Dictyostelium purpureum]EGC30741.1 hypothetical protein DICPUDRAFT_99444 [Dictyostelium purpureum]|eukprot:XP_003292725.1 hypothetical protein DICPUDRAFT_99444 [Dictyostelium purpureum]
MRVLYTLALICSLVLSSVYCEEENLGHGNNWNHGGNNWNHGGKHGGNHGGNHVGQTSGNMDLNDHWGICSMTSCPIGFYCKNVHPLYSNCYPKADICLKNHVACPRGYECYQGQCASPLKQAQICSREGRCPTGHVCVIKMGKFVCVRQTTVTGSATTTATSGTTAPGSTTATSTTTTPSTTTATSTTTTPSTTTATSTTDN